MANLFEPPPTYNLPLVKGQDLVVDFKNRQPDSNPPEYLPYAEGTSVSLIIDTDPPTVAPAVLDGIHAVCRLESEVCDRIPARVPWRCRITLDDDVDLVAIHGVTTRFDGKN